MRCLLLGSAGAALVAASLLGGCSKLGLGGGMAQSNALPTPKQLKSIRYMTRAPGPGGRRIFSRLRQARSCHDLEIAMRWNRPPDVRGGPFDKKMVYISARVPADLANDSEVFVSGKIEQGRSLPSGGSIWALRLRDGREVQAVEAARYTQKQDEAQQAGGHPAMIHPYTRARTLCAYGIYQGDTGFALNGHGRVPLVSVLFAMDRRR